MHKREILDSYVAANLVPTLKDDSIVYLRGDTLPSAAMVTGNVTTSTDVAFGTTSLELSSASIALLSTPTVIDTDWVYQGWFKLKPATVSTLLRFNGDYPLSIVADSFASSLAIQYEVATATNVGYTFNIAIDNVWHFWLIERKGTTLAVYIDCVKVINIPDFNYPPLLIQSVSISNANLYTQSVLFDYQATNDLPLHEERDIYRHYYQPYSPDRAGMHDRLLSLKQGYSADSSLPVSVDSLNSVARGKRYIDISPSQEGVNSLTNPRGLFLHNANQWIDHPSSFVVNTCISVSGYTESSVLVSTYDSIRKTGFYIAYDKPSNSIVFAYFTTSLKIVPLCAYTDTPVSIKIYNHKDTTLLIRVNGKNVYQTSQAIKMRGIIAYRFNYGAIDGTLRLYQFCLSKLNPDYYSEVDERYSLLRELPIYSYKPQEPFKRHQIIDRFGVPPLRLPFTTSATSLSIQPLQTISFDIVQSIYTRDVTYSIRVYSPSFTDLTQNDVTITNSTVIAAGNSTSTVTVSMGALNKSKKLTGFEIVVSNGLYEVVLPVTISSVAAFDQSSLRLPGFIDLLEVSSTGTPKLVPWNTVTADGVVPAVSSIHGPAYRITNQTEALTLSTSVSNIRTAILIYHEVSPVSNRIYFGGNSPTFNGGPSGQLVGDLITSPSSFINIRRDNGVYKDIRINSTGNLIVRANELTDKIEILKKNGNTWPLVPTVLNLGLQSPSTSLSASIDIAGTSNYFALGFPNANNAEGVVQVWNSTGLIKELHLGSPYPVHTTGGFGKVVRISNDGLTLYVVESNTNKVFIYRKVLGSWSAVPLYTITEPTSITEISTSGSYLAVTLLDNTSKIYEEVSSAWVIRKTYTGTQSAKLDKFSNKLAVSTLSGILNIYQTTDLSNKLSTIPIPTYPAYSNFDICDESVLAISTTLGTVTYYSSLGQSYNANFTASYTDYGMYMSLGTNSLLISSYGDILDIYTADSSAYTGRVLSAYVNGKPKSFTTVLPKHDVAILAFTTASPITVDTIGNGYNSVYGANSLKGLVLGAVFYNRVLSDEEIETCTNLLKRLFNIQEIRLSGS